MHLLVALSNNAFLVDPDESVLDPAIRRGLMNADVDVQVSLLSLSLQSQYKLTILHRTC